MLVAQAQQAAMMQQQAMQGGGAPPPGPEAGAGPPPEEAPPMDEAEMTAAQVDGILQELQATNPQAYEQIMSLPQEQQVAAVMEVMQKVGMM